MSVLSLARNAVARHRGYVFRFGLVGASGLVVNTAALLAFTELTPIHYLVGVVAATQVSTTWNFVLTDRFVFTGGGSGRAWVRFLGFATLNNAALLVRGPIIVLLTDGLGLHYAISNLVTLVLVMAARYGISAGFLWRSVVYERQTVPLFKRLEPTPELRRSTRWIGDAWSGIRQSRLRRYVFPASLFLFLVAAAVVRFWNLDTLALNSDEAVYTGQGAALAELEPFNRHFSVFRAHPLLFQYVVSLLYRIHFWDTAGRWVSALFGLGTVWITYKVAALLVSKRVAVVAAAFLLVMPYHVVVSRQALLESPMTFFTALTMYALVRYRETSSYLSAAGIGLAAGLAFLSKETAVIVLLSVGVFVALRGGWETKRIGVGLAAYVLTVSPHLYATAVRSGAEGEGGAGWLNYVLWQVSRPPNHPDSFYLSNALHYVGLPMLLLALTGVVWLVVVEGRKSDRSVLLLAWAAVPVLIFQLWPVKGYHYLLPAAPAVAVIAALGAVALGSVLTPRMVSQDRALTVVNAAVGLALIVGVVVSSINGPIVLNHERIGDAGYSGLPGARELVSWISSETPVGARFLGIGPSITNVIAFYSDRDAFALSVSPNPVRRNPAYEVVRNADYDLRWGLYEYMVYDAYSAERTSHFANRLLDLAARYGGDVLYEEEGFFVADDGQAFIGPVFRVYRVKAIESGSGKDSEE